MEGTESDCTSEEDFVPKRIKINKSCTPTSASSSSKSDVGRCSHCSSEFVFKNNVLRHQNFCTKNPKFKATVFKCSKCSKSFNRRDNLSVHIKKCLAVEGKENDNAKFVCSFCSCNFDFRNVAQRHERGCKKNPNYEAKVFKCPKCNLAFGRKDNMSVHMRNCCGSKTEKIKIIACSFCPVKFVTKKVAQRHEKVCSKNPNCGDQRFECPNCNVSFSRKDNMFTHSKTCMAGEMKKKTVNCLHEGCGISFTTKTALIKHLRKAHNSVIDPEKYLSFQSEAAFKAWKEQEEERTFSYFSQNCGDKGTRTYLYCQHDGSDKAHRKKDTKGRITSRKNRIGQIKSGDICISKMVVVSNKNGSCEVTYYPSHSHELSEHDLAHHPVADSTNTFIDNLIALNVPARQIHQGIQAPMLDRDNRDADYSVTKNLMINERRIKQRIARRRNNLRLHKDDATSVYLLAEVLQQEKYDPVIIYKPVGMDVVAGPQEILNSELSSDLFMFGLQTKEQRKLMVEGCKKILLADDTHNVTQYENVKLLNLMVVDHNNRGWPAGHFISNCMSADVIKLFIRALKLRCKDFNEDLVINCVITDDDAALIKGIEFGMGKDIRHILCQWHLDNTLKDKLREKVPQILFDSLYSELKVIIGSKDKSEFLGFYEVYKNKHSEHASELIKYLIKYYDHRTDKWAMCYREGLGHGNVNTTGHLESFHNTIKTGRFNRTPNKRMDDLIYGLLDIEKDHYEARLREDILGFRESPDKIRERHERGYSLDDKCIEEINSCMWRVFSCSKPDLVYHISRLQEFCTKDHCFDKCTKPSCHGLCSHIFICSCLDTVPLCKHIHKLQSYLFRDKPCPAYEESNTDGKVAFFSMKEDNMSIVAQKNADFSEANSYKRLEANLTTFSEFVFKRSIPSHLVSSCDTTIGDLVKKCSILSLSTDSQDLPSMPGVMKIAPKQKLRTQISQLCKFKRKIRNKKFKAKNDAEFFSRNEAAKNNLLSWVGNDAGDDPLDLSESGGEVDDCEEGNSCVDSSSNLKGIALSIGEYKISYLDLKTISLHISEEDLAHYQSLDLNFHKGWLKSEVINAFLFTLALINESVYVGANELALSMSRGNTLTRIFKEEMPHKKIFLFPANFSEDHWTMIAVLAEKAEILFMDPKQGKPTPQVMKCIATIEKIMKVVKPSVLKWTTKEQKYCYQNDSVNCGVHICWFGHQIISESKDLSDLSDMTEYRAFIYKTICGHCLKFTSDLDVCIVCSSAEPPVETDDDFELRCTKCKRLYHASCIDFDVDMLVDKDEFVCPEFSAID